MSEKKPTPLIPARAQSRCPVCGQISYSRAGIHPQCSVRQADEEHKNRIKREKALAEVEKTATPDKWNRALAKVLSEVQHSTTCAEDGLRLRSYFHCQGSSANPRRRTNMIAIWIYIVAAATLCGLVILVASYLPLWLQAYFTGTRISLLDLVLMSLRKSNPRAIVQCKVMAVQSGLAALSTSAIEAQYLAGGDVHRVTLALIAAEPSRHLSGLDHGCRD